MSRLVIRPATRDDVAAIVAMLADDPLGAAREDLDDPGTYDAAYDRVVADPGQHLVVAELDGTVVGTLQLSVIPTAPARSSPSLSASPGTNAGRVSGPSSSPGRWTSRGDSAPPSCS